LPIYKALINEIRAGQLTADWMRRAQLYTVCLFRPKEVDPVCTYLEPVNLTWKESSNEWFIYSQAAGYDRLLGLLPPNAPALWLV